MSLLLTASEVMQVMDMDLALAAVTEAFRAHGEGRVNLPPKVHLVLPRGSFKAMFGEIFLPGGHICGVKWNSNFPENPRHGGLTIKGKLLLNDPETGLEVADLDATRITNFRTGAAGGARGAVPGPAGGQPSGPGGGRRAGPHPGGGHPQYAPD